MSFSRHPTAGQSSVDSSRTKGDAWSKERGTDAAGNLRTDATGRDEARAKLLLADRLAAVGTLAAGAAHEINNPLTYAMINTEHVLRQLRTVAAEERPNGKGMATAASGAAERSAGGGAQAPPRRG